MKRKLNPKSQVASASPQSCTLLYRRFATCVRRTLLWTSAHGGASADCKSAIQQITNLRYGEILLLLAVFSVTNWAQAQSTAFTYNGRLNLNGVLVNGPYEMRFTLYDASAGGATVGSPLTINSVQVVNGLFATRIDFGANAFTGPARWLEVAVHPVSGGAFTFLTPRQEMTSSPYAVRAQTAGRVASGVVAASQLNTGGVASTPGQFLSYDGGNLYWSDPGVAAGNIFSLNGTSVFYNAGNVGIGTSAPANKLTVRTPTLGYGKLDVLSDTGTAIVGKSTVASGVGVYGESAQFNGVRGVANNVAHGAVVGVHNSGGLGVLGVSSGTGVQGESTSAGGLGGYFRNTAGGIALKVQGTAQVNVLQILGGADLAEPFILSTGDIAKGSVVVIDDEHPGKLKLSTRAYDTRVAGIVSGANGVNPGISLQQEGVLEGGQNVSLSGRVYVLADAVNGPIKPGDLLTTSDTPGHAMKVADHARAQGAILGKGMSGLKQSQGMVLVLVTLQ